MEKRGDFRIGKSHLEDGNLADNFRDFEDLMEDGLIKFADIEKIERRSKKSRKRPKEKNPNDDTQ